jgi:uncharacterized protein
MIYPGRCITIATAIILLACAGCAQVAYDTLNHSQSIDCQRLQGAADRADCTNRSNLSYQEYRRQLDTQKKDK